MKRKPCHCEKPLRSSVVARSEATRNPRRSCGIRCASRGRLRDEKSALVHGRSGGRSLAWLAITAWLALSIRAGLAAQEPTPTPPAGPAFTIGDAIRATLERNPDLLNSLDTLSVTRWSEKAVRSSYFPQFTPFLATARDPDTGQRIDSYGFDASEQFPFGPLFMATGSVTRDPVATPATPYVSGYHLTLTQPLLKGVDPAVTREPLRQARRATQRQERALEVTRRQAILAVYSAYLAVVREDRALAISRERLDRAHELTAFSRARFAAGSVSRLDVLRAEQQEASTQTAVNDEAAAAGDARDILRRTAGLPRDMEFAVRIPGELPVSELPLNDAVAGVMDRRPEAQEARDEVVDAEFSVRIAKNEQLPSLSAVLGYTFAALGTRFGDVWKPQSPIFTFGFRTDYNFNATSLYAARRTAEVQLETRRRNLSIFEDDLVRDVRRTYRRLEAVTKNLAIATENLRVAELQLDVARLRFEKGLSDNFNVVDAENLLNTTKLFELDQRIALMLARLDCLFASGALSADSFRSQP
jgi:outer membrane protein